jgi:hypothetical protein
MFSRILVVSLLIGACSATKPAVMAPKPIDKPYLILNESCTHDPDTDTTICEGEGFRNAIRESGEQTKRLKELEAEKEALEAHNRVESWFLEGQLTLERKKRREAEDDKWLFAGIGAAVGAVIIGIIWASIELDLRP